MFGYDAREEYRLLRDMYAKGFEHIKDMPELLARQLEAERSLKELFLCKNGSVHPRGWIEGFRHELESKFCKSLEDLEEQIDLTDIADCIDKHAGNSMFPAGIAYNSEHDWRASNNQAANIYSGTLNYGATGEGSTMIFASTRAFSLGEFIFWFASEVSHYFAYGSEFYLGLPPTDNSVCKYLLTKDHRKHLQKEADAPYGRGGSVRVMLYDHINYS